MKISTEVTQRFSADGAIVVRRCVSAKWIEVLRAAVERDIASPGPFAHGYDALDGGGAFHGNLRTWENDAGFRSFCFESALPELAAALLGSKRVNLLYDQLFVKEPGTANRTRWHNDQPYWAIRGGQVLTFWVALDSVAQSSGALEFIRGSHRWGRWFQPEPFGEGAGVQDYEQNPDYEPIPDIEAARGRYDIVSWELEPGDVYAFHGLTVHGAGGNSSRKVRRRGYAVRYTGDDVVYDTRPGTNRNLRSDAHRDGALLDSEQYPVVYGRTPLRS